MSRLDGSGPLGMARPLVAVATDTRGAVTSSALATVTALVIATVTAFGFVPGTVNGITT
jgi:hypothetical protein